MRTPSIDTLSRKVATLEKQLEKYDAKKAELAEARKILASLASPENREKAVASLDRQREKLARLEAQLAAFDEDEFND